MTTQSATSQPDKIPTILWVTLQVLVPLIPVFVGIFFICFAVESKLTMIELLKGVVLGLLALSLISNCVCAYWSASYPLSKRDFAYLLTAFIFVLCISIIYVTLETIGSTQNKEVFVGTQGLLTVVSSIFGWRMR